MFCRSCGMEICDDANFCPHCGDVGNGGMNDTSDKLDFVAIKQRTVNFVEKIGFSKMSWILSAVTAGVNIILRFFQTGRIAILIFTILHLLLSAALVCVCKKKDLVLEVKPLLGIWAATLISVVALF